MQGLKGLRVGMIGTYISSCQNDGPFLGTLNNRCRVTIRTQKGTIILTTTHMFRVVNLGARASRVVGALGSGPARADSLKPGELASNRAGPPSVRGRRPIFWRCRKAAWGIA